MAERVVYFNGKFFMVRDGEIITPQGHNILRGVSRGACIELAHELDILLREADIDPYDVREADEAWSEEVGVDIAAQAREYAGMMDTWTP